MNLAHRLRLHAHYANRDLLLLAGMAVLMAAIKAGLVLLPFQKLRHLLGWLAQRFRTNEPTDPRRLRRIVVAATITGKKLFGGKACLVQALTVHFLYHCAGYPAQLRIGVGRSLDGALEAHAWIESQGKIVIGDDGRLQRYTPFPLNSSLDNTLVSKDQPSLHW
jgi:hypothetical protein